MRTCARWTALIIAFWFCSVAPSRAQGTREDYQRAEQFLPGNLLARSTDGGKSFQNYSWTDQPFDAKGIFMGDYTGLAPMNGRVCGIWPERPANSTTRDTVIRIGIADFSSGGAGVSSAQRKANLE